MSYRINTNVAALNAQVNTTMNQRNLQDSLGKLSSGLRIQSAADDASGMTIADSLRSQANALGQAIQNGNDAIGIVQTADKAMDEQIKILDTIKTKSIQAAQDGQSTDSRKALQSDISKLLEELDNIANTTSFNGQQLLNGSFSNKSFQIGAYSNETVKVSIGATASNTIGHTRFETTGTMNLINSKAKDFTLKFSGIDGFSAGYVFQTVSATVLENQGLAAIAEQVNEVSDKTGIRASVNNTQTFSGVTAGTITGALMINGVKIANNLTIEEGDKSNVLLRAINDVKDQTGVEASNDNGKLVLTARDGRAINFAGSQKVSHIIASAKTLSTKSMLGQLTFVRQDARDIVMVASGVSTAGLSTAFASGIHQATVSLKDINANNILSSTAAAMGFFNPGEAGSKQNAGVTSIKGAQAMIDIADSARKTLDSIRSDLGSVQNQLVSTINNISVTQVNVKSAESQIRDVDFGVESANFSKFNILAQSGSYAMSQANAVQQNVLRLLQ